MRLIDADKLPEHKFTRESAKGSDYMRGWNDAIDAIIDNAPTVDVKSFALVRFDKDELKRIVDEQVIEPIKNGELVVKKERPQGEWITDERGYVCSECGALHSDDYPFCHMCGADMRKEAENE